MFAFIVFFDIIEKLKGEFMIKIKKLIALVMIIIMSAAVFVGCGLFTRNQDSQLALTVGEIKRECPVCGEQFEEKISRRDLIVYYYNNKGSDRVNNGEKLEDVLKEFLDLLIKRKVFFVEAKIYFCENTTDNPYGTEYTDSDFDGQDEYSTFKDFKYLTTDELEKVFLQLEYNNRETLNNYKNAILEEWFPSKSEDKKVEPSYNPQPDAKIEDAPKDPQEPKEWELPEEYFENETAKRTALKNQLEAEAISRFRNQIAAEEYTDAEYLQKQREAAIEQKIIEKYRDVNYRWAREDLEAGNYSKLEEIFNQMRDQQVEKYRNDPDAFFAAATSPSDDNFLLFYPNYGTSIKYITVKNLLIKFDDDISSALSTLKSAIHETSAYEDIRDALITQLVARDRRDPHYIENLYTDVFGAKVENGEVQFDKDGKEIKSETGFSQADFELFVNGLLDAAGTGTSDAAVAARITAFTDLIYAYGQDTGMFNANYDYVVGPAPVIGKTESFVTEFANASRTLTQKGEIVAVVTDFGLHIIMCTDIIVVSEATLVGDEILAGGKFVEFNKSDLNSDNLKYDSLSYKFYKYTLTNFRDEKLYYDQIDLVDLYETEKYITKYLSNIEDLWNR